MLFELLAAISAAVAAGGIAFLLRRFIPALPGWLIPAAAGAGLLTVSIALEYSWYRSTAEALPERVEVALAPETRAPWRPWTFLRPTTDRFIAVDQGSRLTHPAAPERRILDLLVFQRWTPPRRVRAAFDCAAGRRVDLVEDVRLGADGTIEGAEWLDTGFDDPITRTACAGA